MTSIGDPHHRDNYRASALLRCGRGRAYSRMMAAATDSLRSGELCTLVACSPYGAVSGDRPLRWPSVGDDVAVRLDLSNYELLWPAPLFAVEDERILRVTGHAWEEQAQWLLTEAVAGTTGASDFEESLDHNHDPFASTTGSGRNHAGQRVDWFTEPFQLCRSMVRTAAAIDVIRFGLHRALRKIRHAFSRAMPRSTGARAADSALLTVCWVGVRSLPSGRLRAVVTHESAPV